MMKTNKFFITSLIVVALINSSFQCNKTPLYSCESGYKTIGVYAQVTPASNSFAFAMGDTFKFSSVVSDTLRDTALNSYQFTLDPLAILVEVFKVVVPAGSTIPTLQPVPADFNQVIFDGQIDANTYGQGLKFNYRRLQSRNYLSAGLECSKRGKYFIRFTSQQGYYQSNLYNYSLYPCTNFSLQNLYSGPQNAGVFTQYNLTTINPSSGYTGYRGVAKTDTDYVVLDIN